LLQILTHFEIAVEGDYKEMTWHIEKEVFSDAALNLLCYFYANYPNFKWNEEKNIFENNDIQISPIGKENVLFQLLNSKNDSTALDAFIQLTTCNPAKVIELADEYEEARIYRNYIIPIFPYRFLKQLVILTEYCAANEIDFNGSIQLKTAITQLQSDLSFSERRELEDRLINNLTLEEITAFEYWVLIYESSWRLTYSAGRILDIFYSKNWDKLMEDKQQLDCYLKKSILFSRLGINGICNNYLKKFDHSQQNILDKLENYQTSDEDIKIQIEKIISKKNSDSFEEEKENETESFSWEGNNDYGVKDIEKQLNKLMKDTKKINFMDYAISGLLSQISYEQIPTAMTLIENIHFEHTWKKYSFIEDDFGFFEVGNFNKEEVRNEFLSLYSRLSEYELYAYYLDKAGIDYETNNDLDFDKIYEILKYNIVAAFVGSMTSKNNEVYSLIKLLELTFDTTLGFPKKLCNSNNMYACSSNERAKAWREYLLENNLLKKQHNEPVSFKYE
jgi:hypothetical protein